MGGQCDWPALQDDYTFLMSCDLIESCRSVNTEMSWDNGDLQHLKMNLSAAAVAAAAAAAAAAASTTPIALCQTDAEITTPGLLLFIQLFLI